MKALLIDGNNFIWRAYYSLGTDNNGVSTGILKFINHAVTRFQPDEVIICWDIGKSRWRSELYPEYKAARKDKQDELPDLEEIRTQAEEAKRLLRAMSIRQIAIRGIEADDTIAWLSDYYRRYLQGTVVIVSTDKDLWQLLQDQVFQYDPIKDQVFTIEDVQRVLDIPPVLISDYKTLCGDPSDGIPGAKGIGPKIATKLLAEYKDFGNILNLDNVEEFSKKKKTTEILKSAEDLEIYNKIVKLSPIEQSGRYLSQEEYDEFVRQATEPLEYNQDEVNLFSEIIGSGILGLEGLPRATNNLYHIAKFMNFETPQIIPWEDLDRSILECHKCPLRACCDEYGPTLAEGYEDAQIMVVARNPGADELVGGRPLIGRAGKTFDRFLDLVGLTRRDCWITNVNKCYSEGNRPPTHGEVMSCISFLKSEVHWLKPKLVITFGNEAMSMFTPHMSGVSRHVGEIMENSTGLVGVEVPYVAIVNHPSHAMRAKKNMTDFEFAASKVKEFLDKRRG